MGKSSSGYCSEGEVDVCYVVAVLLDILIGLPSNAGVLWLPLTSRRGLLSPDVLLLNLAFAEIIICRVLFVSAISNLNVGVPLTMSALHFFYGLFLTGRPLFKCCICVERYLAVVHPVTFLKYKVVQYQLPCLASVWFLTLVFCTVRVFDQSYYISGVVVVVTFAVNSFCSLSILKVLRKPQPGDVMKKDLNLMKRRAFRTILVIQVMMLLNYLPVLLITPLEHLFSDKKFYCKLFLFTLSLLVCGSFVHPFLYFSREGMLPCST